MSDLPLLLTDTYPGFSISLCCWMSFSKLTLFQFIAISSSVMSGGRKLTTLWRRKVKRTGEKKEKEEEPLGKNPRRKTNS